MRRAAALLLCVAPVLALAACGDTSGSSDVDCHNSFRSQMLERTTPPPMTIDPAKAYKATVHTSRGDFTIELDAKAAPVTVNNFISLAKGGFYDCLTFHRVEDFVIQGGDPLGNGTGGTGYTLPDETNPAPWDRGSVGMASGSQGVNGAQFFILKQDSQYLSQRGVYNHFGVVNSGMDVIDGMQKGDTINGVDVAG